MGGSLSCPASVCFDKKKEVVKRKQAVELGTGLGWTGLVGLQGFSSLGNRHHSSRFAKAESENQD